MPSSHTPENQPEQARATGRGAALEIARVFGIHIRIHISIVVIFALIAASLGGGLFPAWQPGWTPLQSWLAGFVAGIAFFVSLLLHELSHAVTAKSRGIEITGITLFLFGGMAEMQGEPQTPKDEFLVAAAGPLASFALAALFSILAGIAVGSNTSVLQNTDTIDLTGVSAFGTICLWLSLVNFMLAVFNLLPGFPMDGGRLLRAFLWWRRHDLVSATRSAARMGSIVGSGFILLGLLQVFNGQLINGLWLVLIGWFIHRLAQTSIASLLVERALSGFDVSRVMRTRFERVPSDVSLRQFRDDYLLRSAQHVWPVHSGDQDIGFITLEDLQRAIEQHTTQDPLEHGTVGELAHPLHGSGVLSPDLPAQDALRILSQAQWPMPVVSGSTVLGIVHQADILRWLSLHPSPDTKEVQS